ncbi:MAG: Mur ligase family protein, partial [Chloroflexota bacterium]|nr:Mur ligase family protein [Chloroflexota bacterium]
SKNLGSNAHDGSGAYFVIEADEYDHMFWGLRPDIALVTNVEHDHPDYYPTAKEFFQAFLGFIERIKPGGVLITCENDPGAALLRIQAEEKNIPTISYGLQGTHYECYAQNVVINTSGGYAFEATCAPLEGDSGTPSVQVNLQVPGEYNVRNALATLAVTHALGLPLHQAALALNNYKGTERRFEIIGQACGVILIDDYAHHPTEIRATIKAARERYPTRSLWVVWQPHTYSRTRTLLDQYLTAFESAHHILATEVYAAREAVPADNFSAQQITQAMSHNDVEFVPDLVTAKETLLRRLGSHDVLLVLSAGDADQLNQALLAELLAREDTGLKNNLNYQNINNFNVN